MKINRFTPLQRLLDTVCLAIVIATVLYIAVSYGSAPDKIPGHYNSAGEATDYTGKGVIWVLAGAELALWVMMAAFSRIPAITRSPNMPWKIAHGAQENISRVVISMLCWVNLECCAMFSYFAVMIMHAAAGHVGAVSLGFTAIKLVTIAICMVRLFKVSKIPVYGVPADSRWQDRDPWDK